MPDPDPLITISAADLERLYVTRASFDAVKEELAVAQALVNSYEEYYGRVISEQCAPDEKHCTCVPALRQRIEQLEAAAAWIPVDKPPKPGPRLPEHSDYVWTITASGYAQKAYYDFPLKQFCSAMYPCDPIASVTHWRPLPPPPPAV